MTAAKTAKVVVRQPFKVTQAGVDYWPGDTAAVPPRVAQEWTKLGFTKLFDAAAEPASDTDPTEPAQPKTTAPKPSRRWR
ncbi:hypothetical protein [Mycobacterium parmense]|uniref:Uncharacterized protein n=1 Tax=Mycobacterium parmense TaxID=185642 RepID=A0A7I7YTZ3_9MYCO|nr:hypothetical protein [Mycobacterium parmense]MCV7351793.1 hypothetical protein [Mycobacterium parmense]ORW63013.1 hypothetical protein AWC20_04575 [Mycobacterium parmense]BBZ44737.1 hypothetical protein MPRM_20180 [Mycobacterium parmense]